MVYKSERKRMKRNLEKDLKMPVRTSNSGLIRIKSKEKHGPVISIDPKKYKEDKVRNSEKHEEEKDQNRNSYESDNNCFHGMDLIDFDGFSGAFLDFIKQADKKELSLLWERRESYLTAEQGAKLYVKLRLMHGLDSKERDYLEFIDSDLIKNLERDFEKEAGSAVLYGKKIGNVKQTIRQGQEKFRKHLLAAHGGKCAVTGCSVIEVLEAAHIASYNGSHTNSIGNGLMLRSDIHRLFDSNLLAIDPNHMVVRICKTICNSEYNEFDNKPIPPEVAIIISRENLFQRWELFEKSQKL